MSINMSFTNLIVAFAVCAVLPAHNFTSEAHFLKACDDCLLMRYSTVKADGKKGTHLLFYGKKCCIQWFMVHPFLFTNTLKQYSI